MVTKIMVYHNFGKRYTAKRYTVIQKLRNSIYRSTGILNTSTIFSEFFSSNIAVYRKPRYQYAVNRNLVIFSSGFAVNHIACMRFTVLSGYFFFWYCGIQRNSDYRYIFFSFTVHDGDTGIPAYFYGMVWYGSYCSIPK